MTAPQTLSPVLYETPFVTPLTGGLYAAATGPLEAPGHWFSGISLRSRNCPVVGQAGVWEVDECFVPLDPDATKFPDGRPGWSDPFLPLTVWGADACDPHTTTDDELLSNARQNLRITEQNAVETAFADLLLTEATAPSVPGAPAATDIVSAVALLEAAAARHRLPGVIHASPYWAASATDHDLAKGAPLAKSPLGHSWAFGGGYVDTLQNTLVITGPVTLWAGPTTERVVTDPRTGAGTRYALVERTVLVAFECFAYKVTITPSTP